MRIAIIATILVVWEALAASGLLFRDVVPSLFVDRRGARIACSSTPDFYWHLGVTAGEVGTGAR